MKNSVSGPESWAQYYKNRSSLNLKNYYPENFVSRVFLSKSPVKFIDCDYQGKQILDLGCGHGRHIPFLIDLGLNPTGLEVSQQQIDELKTNFARIPFIKGTAKEIDSPAESYDFVLACNSIYYLASKSDLAIDHFKECHRVLRKGGLLIFTLMGPKHSIFDGAEEVASNGVFKIENDFLGFRDGVCIQAYSTEFLSEVAMYFDIQQKGEIVEAVDNHCRHVFYFVAKKVAP